jgi:hypothetical protein
MATALQIRNDIKKVKTSLKNKRLSAVIKKKLESSLKKLEGDLASLKSGKASKGVTKTKVLTNLQKLKARVKKTPSLARYKNSGVDLEKDADIPALPMGRRVSQGIKGNQYADKKSAKGNVYYEYHVNRLDIKQPPKRYPKLEDGGETSSKRFNTQYNVGKSKYVINYNDGTKTHKDGSPFFDLATFKNMKDFIAYKNKLKSEGYKEYKDGGMMADEKIRFDMYGYKNVEDRVQDGDVIIRVISYKEAENKAKQYLNEKGYKLVELYRGRSFYGSVRKEQEFVKSDRYKEKEEYMADGGMMADGGGVATMSEKEFINIWY